MSKLPPINFVDLDTVCQVGGTLALLRDHGLRSQEATLFQGPTLTSLDQGENIKKYRGWLMDHLKKGREASDVAEELVFLTKRRADLAAEGRALTLAYEGTSALPFVQVIARCLDYLADKGLPSA